MFEYLYYKFYQAALKSSLKDIPHIAASSWLGLLLTLNFAEVTAFLAKTTSFHWFFKNHKDGAWFCLILIILLILFFTKKRRGGIIEKYSKENSKQRVNGNFIVASYVIISWILIFVIAYYKPGKL